MLLDNVLTKVSFGCMLLLPLVVLVALKRSEIYRRAAWESSHLNLDTSAVDTYICSSPQPSLYSQQRGIDVFRAQLICPILDAYFKREFFTP